MLGEVRARRQRTERVIAGARPSDGGGSSGATSAGCQLSRDRTYAQLHGTHLGDSQTGVDQVKRAGFRQQALCYKDCFENSPRSRRRRSGDGQGYGVEASESDRHTHSASGGSDGKRGGVAGAQVQVSVRDSVVHRRFRAYRRSRGTWGNGAKGGVLCQREFFCCLQALARLLTSRFLLVVNNRETVSVAEDVYYFLRPVRSSTQSLFL